MKRKSVQPSAVKRRKFRNAITNPLGLNSIAWPSERVEDAIYVDEVGRGCWMGPMCIGAVFLLPGFDASGAHDSKLLKEHEREALYEKWSVDPNLVWHVDFIPNTEIDDFFIVNSWMRGVKRAVDAVSAKLSKPASIVVIDGDMDLKIDLPTKCEPKADSKYVGVAVASIMAKVVRDRYMVEKAKDYPEEFQAIMTQGKGYAWLPIHRQLVESGKYTDLHRKSFRPLKDFLAQQKTQ